MADAGAVVQMRGFCLKRNRDYRKANLLGSKYHRRWVELTKDTFVYAKSHSEVISGKIQVFAIHELAWVRKEGAAKWSIKFPERMLTFKVESGSTAERDRWVEAIEAARSLAQEGADGPTARELAQLGALQKKAEDSLLNDEQRGSSAGSDGGWQISAAMTPHSTAGRTPLRLGSQHGSRSGRGPGEDNDSPVRPPSPRSLLANARNGTAFVASPRAAPVQMRASALARWQQQSTCDSSDEGEQDGAGCLQYTDSSCPAGQASSRHVADTSSEGEDSDDDTTGSFDMAPPSPTIQRLLHSQSCQQPRQQLQQQREEGSQRPGTAGSSTSTGSRQLVRRTTPGFMLIDPSASAVPSSFSSAAASPSSRPSSSTPLATAKQHGGILKRPASSTSLPPVNHNACNTDDEDEEDVLVLESVEAQRPSSAQQPSLPAQRLAPDSASTRQSPLHTAAGATAGAASQRHTQQPPQRLDADDGDDELLVLDAAAGRPKPSANSTPLASHTNAGTTNTNNSNSSGATGSTTSSSNRGNVSGGSAHNSRPPSAAAPVPEPPAGPPPAASRPVPRPPPCAPTSQRRVRPGGAAAAALAAGGAGAPSAAGAAAVAGAGRMAARPPSHATAGAGGGREWLQDDWDADDAELNTSTQTHSGLSGSRKQAQQHASSQSAAVTEDWDA